MAFLTARRLLASGVAVVIAASCVSCSHSSNGSSAGPLERQPSPSPSTPSSSPLSEGKDKLGERIEPSFFGMHEGRLSEGIAPPAPVGALRLWDSGTSWAQLETSPGRFDWEPLDRAVATAEKADARPLLVLGQTPTFYASRPQEQGAYGAGAASMPALSPWRRYVRAVVDRYGNRLDYQIWNEANVIGYWSGTPGQMARLTVVASRIIKNAVPGATVVAPPFALRLTGQRRSFDRFWALQGQRLDLAGAVDAVAVHLYPPADGLPEASVKLLRQARRVLTKYGIDLPVWDTEVNYGLQGGPEPPPISAERQRAYLIRTYLLNAGYGVQRLYWYRWDIGRIANTYLTEEDLTTKTLAGRSFRLIRDWLEGVRMEGCEAGTVGAGVWTCTAQSPEGTRIFAWKPRGAVAEVVFTDADHWVSGDDIRRRCTPDCRVAVGITPVMVVQDQ